MSRIGDTEIEVATSRQGRHYEMKNAHFHPAYEIYYLHAGTRQFFIESDIYNVNKGDLVLLDKYVMHKTGCSSEKLNERTYILFNDKHIANIIEEYGRDEIKECFEKRVFSIPVQRREYVEGLISQLENEFKNKDEFSERLMRCYLTEIIVFLIRYKRYFAKVNQGIDVFNKNMYLSSCDESIQLAAKHIMENFNKNITLGDVAKYVNMSSTYFSKKFKEVTGFGFKEYLLNLRIKKACELLLETKMSVTEIAYETGFNDSNYFGDVFKKSKGLSPMKYRRNREGI